MFESVKKICGGCTVTVKKAGCKKELIEKDSLQAEKHRIEDYVGFSEVIRKITNSVGVGGAYIKYLMY